MVFKALDKGGLDGLHRFHIKVDQMIIKVQAKVDYMVFNILDAGGLDGL